MTDATYVIVGASLAGSTAAITLREEGAKGRVILIGAEAEPPYERPPLSKAYLRGEVPFEKALVRPPSFYAEHGIEMMLGTRVAKGDADRIRKDMISGRRAVVVGMGFIGSEVAASLRHAGVDVVAIDPAKTPLLRVLGEAVGQRIADLHHAHGVHTIFEDTVSVFEGTGRVEGVLTKAGTRIKCDFAVVGIGVEPVVDLLDGSSIHVENGVLVDEYCETNVHGMFAAGDVANHHHPVFGRRMRVEHWHNAIKQGAAAARNMLGRRIPYDEVHWFWSDQYDANLQYAGYHTDAEHVILRGALASDSFLACFVNGGRIDGALAFNRAKDLRRVMPLIKSRREVNIEDLRDETVDLRSLSPA